MISLIIFILVCYGTTNVITGSKIFAPIRDRSKRLPGRYGVWFGQLMDCPMCMGFHVGVFWFAVGLIDIDLRLNLGWLAAGSLASGVCWIIRVLLYRLGEDSL